MQPLRLTVSKRIVGLFAAVSLALALAACGGVDVGSNSVAAAAAPGATADAVVAPPTISGSPATSVVVGAKYSFQPSASDASGDALTFSIQNKPSWATFDPASGTLAGTPTANDVGSFQSITISVADGQAVAQLAPFTIEVTAEPTAPTPTPGLLISRRS